jgi:murein DD-endopeptidase MepM/ murein hydrolase activator NlpD
VFALHGEKQLRPFVEYVTTALWLVACSGEPPILSGYGSVLGASGKGFRRQPHDGVDIGADVGSVVFASADGIVVGAGGTDLFGQGVILEHDARIATKDSGGTRWTLYGHLQRTFVSRGQRVRRGDRLGEVGIFAASDGVPHVHWELCRDRPCSRETNEDPLRITVGCYRPGVKYPEDRLVLTYPVRCRR